MTFMLFLGMANAYVMRTNMSVAIVAMVNHSALPKHGDIDLHECPNLPPMEEVKDEQEGHLVWDTDLQAIILSGFFYGYCITQIPIGILAKRYGSLYFLGVGMLINSVFAFFVPIAADHSPWTLFFVRFVQGLGEVIISFTGTRSSKFEPVYVAPYMYNS